MISRGGAGAKREDAHKRQPEDRHTPHRPAASVYFFCFFFLWALPFFFFFGLAFLRFVLTHLSALLRLSPALHVGTGLGKLIGGTTSIGSDGTVHSRQGVAAVVNVCAAPCSLCDSLW